MAKAFARYPLKGYKGVFFILGTSQITGDAERIYYIRYRNPSGKMVEEPVGRSGKPDSMTPAKARAIREDRIRGIALPNRAKRAAERAEKQEEADRWSFDNLWTEWMKVNANKKSVGNDDNRYKTHLQPLFGHKEPKEVLPLEVDRLRVGMLKGKALRPGRKFDPNAKRRSDYSKTKKLELAELAAKRERKPYAVGTVVSVLSLFRRIASFGVKRHLCPGLSFRVEIPKGAKQRTEDMTEGQMARYIQTCREWPDAQEGNFQLLELYTGMRRGETRNLKWSDVDFDRGFFLLRDPKGGEDQKIPMSAPARELLDKHPRVEKNPYVFAGAHGGGRGIRQIAESSRKIRDTAGLPKDYRPNHALRHVFASHLASSGEVDMYVLQRLLTHKSPIMTQRYSHLRDDALKRAADVMGRIVSAAAKEA